MAINWEARRRRWNNYKELSKGDTMHTRKVRVNSTYTYQPVMIDTLHPPFGVNAGVLKAGDLVKVVNMPGCPKANTMGHAYVETLAGDFCGLVHCNSLQP